MRDIEYAKFGLLFIIIAYLQRILIETLTLGTIETGIGWAGVWIAIVASALCFFRIVRTRFDKETYGVNYE